MPGHRVARDQCPSPWSRHVPAPQHESHEPSWELAPAVQFKEQISDRHELIEVTDIPNEYSACLRVLALKTWDNGVSGVRCLERDHGY